MGIITIEKTEDLIKNAFKKAAKEGRAVRKARDKLVRKRLVEANKIKIAAGYLTKKIHNLVTAFPSIDSLHPFYIEMLGTITDIKNLKKSLGHAERIVKLIKKIRAESIKQIYKTKDARKVVAVRKQFFARALSLVKDCEESIELINQAGKEFKNLPTISSDSFSVILAGYPNVGKTTILKRLTGSKPKIAPYPFTTKSIGLGYFEHKYRKIQVIDTPGLLDRPAEKRNPAEKKAIAALKHLADLIIFVIDPTTYCGYNAREQLNLLNEVRKLFPESRILVVVNKADVASKKEIASVREKLKEFILSGKNIDGGLKREIGEIASQGSI